MKKRLWNSHFGNKGIVFTIDATVALIVVITILIVSNFYIYRSVDELKNLEAVRIGDNIIALMEYDDTLKTLDANNIKNEMYLLLPNKYDMRVRITSTSQNISIGGTPPNDRFIGSGKRFSVIINENNADYLTTRFWIWLK